MLVSEAIQSTLGYFLLYTFLHLFIPLPCFLVFFHLSGRRSQYFPSRPSDRFCHYFPATVVPASSCSSSIKDTPFLKASQQCSSFSFHHLVFPWLHFYTLPLLHLQCHPADHHPMLFSHVLSCRYLAITNFFEVKSPTHDVVNLGAPSPALIRHPLFLFLLDVCMHTSVCIHDSHVLFAKCTSICPSAFLSLRPCSPIIDSSSTCSLKSAPIRILSSFGTKSTSYHELSLSRNCPFLPRCSLLVGHTHCQPSLYARMSLHLQLYIRDSVWCPFYLNEIRINKYNDVLITMQIKMNFLF